MLVWNYLRLCRLDVLPIAFLGLLVSARVAGGSFDEFLLPALLVSFISTNFIYSFNAWTDQIADAVNKPHRPLPSGEVRPASALRYAWALLAVSVVYPWFIAPTPGILALYLLLPVLGLLYSARPVRLKRYPWVAVFVVASGLCTPPAIGWFSAGGGEDGIGPLALLFVYCLSVVPLKDIEDATGDEAEGIFNLYHCLGDWLPLLAVAGMAVVAALALALPGDAVFHMLTAVLAMTTLGVVGVFHAFGLNFMRMYRVNSLTIAVVGFLFWLALHYFPPLVDLRHVCLPPQYAISAPYGA